MPDGLTSGNKPPDMLKKLTKPFTKALISVDKPSAWYRQALGHG